LFYASFQKHTAYCKKYYRDFNALETGPPWFICPCGEHAGYSVTICVDREEEIKVCLRSPLGTPVLSQAIKNKKAVILPEAELASCVCLSRSMLVDNRTPVGSVDL